MKISDFIFRYKTWNPNDAICRVRIFVDQEYGVTAVLTDLGKRSTGASVTNTVELARRHLIEGGYIDGEARIVEHYEEMNFHGQTFDIVTVVKDSPNWNTTTVEDVSRLAGCSMDELLEKVENNPRLLREADKVRNHIDPYLYSRCSESLDVINRRNQIAANMVRRSDILGIIESGAGERELQRLLKSDLSLVAEAFAHPEDEYICFSEFPVGAGFVDFVVFSGRSRMDVTLIEIKGADFPIVNTSGYRNLAAKLNEGAQQIRDRLAYVYREYATFRSRVHEILQQVESGICVSNSFVSPIRRLEVDPNKDIHVHYVVIAGRTTNDLEESKVRHAFEISFNPRIRLESWDTWARKLRRA